MFYVKSAVFYLLVLLVQTVLFLWLNLFTYIPDLFLVSVIIVAVIQGRNVSTGFALLAGLLQDVFSFGLYLNTIIKAMVSNIVSLTTDEFVGDEQLLIFALIAIITPSLIILEILAKGWLAGQSLDLFYYVFKIIVTTGLNLVVALLLIPILKGIYHERNY